MVATALWVALALVACSADEAVWDPALPQGFEDAKLPDVELKGYLYMDAGRPISLTSETFTGAAVAGELVSVRRIAGLMGQKEDWLGTRIEFASEREAGLVSDWMAAKTAAPAQVGPQGLHLSMVWGGEQWATALQGQWESSADISIQERYPEIWEVVQLLPSRPPARPVAAGFARDLSLVVQMLLERTDTSFSGLEDALPLVRLHTTAFAVYAEDLEVVPAELTGGTLQEMGLGVVAVTRSEYPGFVLGVVLDGIAGTGGLERVRIARRTFYYRHLGGHVHLMTKSYGSALYVALAPSRDEAQELIAAVRADWS